jgi:O-antigen/teichoic acid export membrane protein
VGRVEQGRVWRWVSSLRASLPLGQMGGASLLLIVSQATTSVLGYVFWLVAARSALPRTVGEVGALLSLLSLVLLFATAGIGTTLLVELARRSGAAADRLFSATLLLSGGIVTGALGVVTLANARFGFWPLLSSPLVAALIVASAVFSVASTVLDTAALSRGAGRLVLVRAAVASGVRLALLSAAVVVGAGLTTTMLLALWAVSLGTSVLVLQGAWRRVGLRMSLQGVRSEMWWLVGRMRYNQLGTLAAKMPPLVLPLLVTWRAGAEANAGFFLAWQLAGGAFMVAGSVSQAFLAQSGDGEDLAARTARAVRLLLVLGVPATLAVAVIGPFVLSLLGAVYAASVTTLLVLVVATPGSATVALVASRLRAERADVAAAALNAVSSLSVLPLAWWWLQLSGPVGAAAAYTVAQTFGALVGVQMLRRRRRRGRVR